MTDTDDSCEVSDYLTTSRRLRPCYRAIDMRGKVAAPCTRYLINDRVHFLDDASFKIFEEGLRRHHGVLTMETFEAVTGLLQPQPGGAEADGPAPAPDQPDYLPDDRSPEPGAGASATAAGVEFIPFGFFAQRREPRAQYVCEIQLNAGGQQARGVTFDLSVNGARISVQDDLNVDVGAIVSVSFMGLNALARGVDVYDVPYHVVRKDRADDAVLLGLRRVDARRFAPFAQFLGRLIARHGPGQDFGRDDDFKTALVWYYERLIAQHSAQIPFFVGGEGEDDLIVDAVAASPGNQALLRFFATAEDNYNFTPLCLPDRLRALAAGETLVLALYRERGEGDRTARIHSASNLDFESDAAFAAFLRLARTHPEHCVLAAVAGRAEIARPNAAKTELFTQRLRALDADAAAQLAERLRRLRFVGYLFDLTALAGGGTGGAAADGAGLVAWVGTELRNVGDGAVLRHAELDDAALRPELVRFGYVERRREERYLARTPVRLAVRDQAYNGMTVDISWRGMRVAVAGDVDIRRGMQVAIGLPSMQKKRGSLDLMEIPYRAVGVERSDQHTLLMLERASGGQDSGTDDFFSELIRNNRYKLRVDAVDSVSAAASGVYESAFAANLPSLAFFIARDAREGIRLQYTGVAAGEDADAQRARTAPLDAGLVKSIYDAVQMQGRRDQAAEGGAPFEFLLYHLPGESEDAGRIVSDFAFEDARARDALLAEVAADARWRVLRVSARACGMLDDNLFGQLLEGVRGRSKHRAIALSDAVSAVVACGELVDVTEAFRRLRHA